MERSGYFGNFFVEKWTCAVSPPCFNSLSSILSTLPIPSEVAYYGNSDVMQAEVSHKDTSVDYFTRKLFRQSSSTVLSTAWYNSSSYPLFVEVIDGSWR